MSPHGPPPSDIMSPPTPRAPTVAAPAIRVVAAVVELMDAVAVFACAAVPRNVARARGRNCRGLKPPEDARVRLANWNANVEADANVSATRMGNNTAAT